MSNLYYGYSIYEFKDDVNDVVINHNENTSSYMYECGRSFVDICKDMGLDKNRDFNISLL